MINIIPNFLQQETIDLIIEKYKSSVGKPVFEVNDMGRWQSNLHHGNFGPVYILPLDQELAPHLHSKMQSNNEFKDHVVSACFLHVWQQGSGINWHHDSIGENHRIGMTVYLNPSWNVNWGGLLLWEKDGQTGWFSPQYNYAVWIQSPLWHSVSIINRAAEYPRLSLQLFLEKRK